MIEMQEEMKNPRPPKYKPLWRLRGIENHLEIRETTTIENKSRLMRLPTEILLITVSHIH